MNQMEQAGSLLRRAADPATRGQVIQQYEHVLKIFQEASELPPTDMDSRVVIARALCRLGLHPDDVELSRRGLGTTPNPN